MYGSNKSKLLCQVPTAPQNLDQNSGKVHEERSWWFCPLGRVKHTGPVSSLDAYFLFEMICTFIQDVF